jgi:hypothetical protein
MGAIIPTTLYLFWDGCDKLTDHHYETTQDILSKGEGEADGTSENGSGEPAGDTDVAQPPAAALQRSTNGRIKTLEDFTEMAPDIDDLDDFLRCTAEEMAKILVEHSALLKGGTMGDKQRRELLQEAMIRKYTKEKLASEVVEVLCKAADAGAQLTSGAGAGSAEKAGPELPPAAIAGVHPDIEEGEPVTRREREASGSGVSPRPRTSPRQSPAVKVTAVARRSRSRPGMATAAKKVGVATGAFASHDKAGTTVPTARTGTPQRSPRP